MAKRFRIVLINSRYDMSELLLWDEEEEEEMKEDIDLLPDPAADVEGRKEILLQLTFSSIGSTERVTRLRRVKLHLRNFAVEHCLDPLNYYKSLQQVGGSEQILLLPKLL